MYGVTPLVFYLKMYLVYLLRTSPVYIHYFFSNPILRIFFRIQFSILSEFQVASRTKVIRCTKYDEAAVRALIDLILIIETDREFLTGSN